PSPPGRPIEELERELGIRDSIKLASNENPLGPSPKAVAAIAAVLADLHRYPDGSAFYLKRRLAERLGVSEAELIVGNGSNEIIELAVRTFLRPGDEAVMADQAFVVYRLVVQSAGGSSRMVPLRDFTHDLEAIAAAVTPRTRLVFLGNPNNPTGTIFRRAAWRAFLGRARGARRRGARAADARDEPRRDGVPGRGVPRARAGARAERRELHPAAGGRRRARLRGAPPPRRHRAADGRLRLPRARARDGRHGGGER